MDLDGLSTEALSDAFEDLPYDVLYNIFLYAPGLKCVASLQGTCRRLYEVGAYEDALWQNQARGFFPTVTLDGGAFIGYYFALRSHVSESKNRALTKLVNRAYQDEEWLRPSLESQKIRASDRQVLLNASEISFRGGHCIGPSAPPLLFSLSGTHGRWLLDTLDFRGMHLRGEGLASLAQGAASLPFLRTLGLRENKLGGANDCVRSGAALTALLQACTTLECVDLTDNGIGGVEGVTNFFSNKQQQSDACATSRIPQRLWLDQNCLGTAGVTLLLSLATDRMRGGSNNLTAAGNNNNSAPQQQQQYVSQKPTTLPALLSLQHVGLGYDHTTSRAVADASRSTIKDMATALEAVRCYIDVFTECAAPVAHQRIEAEQNRIAKRNKKNAAKSGNNNNNNNSLLPTGNGRAEQLGALRHVQVRCDLRFGIQGITQGVLQLQPTLVNSFPLSISEELAKTNPRVQQKFGLTFGPEAWTGRKEFTPKPSTAPRKQILHPTRAFDGRDGVHVEVDWPIFNGPEAGSSCVIC